MIEPRTRMPRSVLGAFEGEAFTLPRERAHSSMLDISEEQVRQADVRDMLAYVRSHRTNDTVFDVVIGGHTSGTDRQADRAEVEQYIAAGATWWLEDVSPWSFGWKWQGAWPMSAMRDRIRHGPPRP